MNPIELSLFSSRMASICEEMGAVLKRAAFSPNIKDRLDFSCAIFDSTGGLTAQAAHIPVHLGSMAFAMSDIVSGIDWRSGDMLVMNDPYMGGTHLPDVTVIAPVYVGNELLAFIANRAHHANIGASVPGSMPVSTSLLEEGVVIKPKHLVRNGVWHYDVLGELATLPVGDFRAQVSANQTGVSRLSSLIQVYGREAFGRQLVALNDYSHRLAQESLRSIPDGEYFFSDYMEDDGAGTCNIQIQVRVSVQDGCVMVDFNGTDGQVAGNINCPLSVAAAAVFYVLRCLMPDQLPVCAGSFRSIEICAPEGSLLNARYPAAVAAGNVETSTRIVDAVLGALAQALPDKIPAASHGSMNNLAMGAIHEDGTRWDYYETIGGGMGASALGPGLNAVQTHMTNTLNTPIESLESHYPLRVEAYQVRRGSGGRGRYFGGDGVERRLRFLEPASVTLLTERRKLNPWGLQGGCDGFSGENWLNNERLPAKTNFQVDAGDELTMKTPGGGGWGSAS